VDTVKVVSEAYSATEWNGRTKVPTFDAVRDKIESVISSIPTNTNQLTNGAGFITTYTETDPNVSAWAKAATKPTYTLSEIVKPSTTQQWTTGTQTLNLSSYANLFVDSITTNVSLTLNTLTDGAKGSILIYKDLSTTYTLSIYGNTDGSGNDITALTPQGTGRNDLTASSTYYDQIEWTYYGGKLVAIKTTLVH
jgi:hypothetical protein